MEYHNPLPTGATKKSVSEFAEDLSERYDYVIGMPIEGIVSQMGGSIRYRNPVDDKPESIIVQPDGRFQIFLPTMTSPARDRFTIAHELGHYFLHFPLVKQRFPNDGMKAFRWTEDGNPELQRCEWEANWFAAAFIMPSNEFKQHHTNGGVQEVARVFGVSEAAARVRASSLGLSIT